jgi:hypothetical protein
MKPAHLGMMRILYDSKRIRVGKKRDPVGRFSDGGPPSVLGHKRTPACPSEGEQAMQEGSGSNPGLAATAPSSLQGRNRRSCNSRVGYSHPPSGSPAQQKSLKRMARRS